MADQFNLTPEEQKALTEIYVRCAFLLTQMAGRMPLERVNEMNAIMANGGETLVEIRGPSRLVRVMLVSIEGKQEEIGRFIAPGGNN